MKMIVVVALALVATVAAAPVESEQIAIVRSEFNPNSDGSFTSVYETANGINHQVTGELKTIVGEDNKEHTVVVLRGSYSYPDKDDGHIETVSYVSDEKGYQAQGPSIPVAPAPVARR